MTYHPSHREILEGVAAQSPEQGVYICDPDAAAPLIERGCLARYPAEGGCPPTYEITDTGTHFLKVLREFQPIQSKKGIAAWYHPRRLPNDMLELLTLD